MSELYNDEFLNVFPTDVFPIAATIPERVSEEAPALVKRVGLGFIIAYAAAYFAIGGGGNYTALFIAAAVFALFGALSIQPVKGVR